MKIFIFIMLLGSLVVGKERRTGPLFQSTKISGMGNANISFVNDQDAIYYNPAAMDVLNKKFHLSLAQTGIIIDDNLLGFASMLMANTKNFKKFADDIESINAEFAKSVSQYDQKWMKVEALGNFDFTVNQFGLGTWSRATIGTYYDDGIFLPEPKTRNELEMSSQLSFGYRLLKNVSVGIAPKYWIRVTDTATVPISKADISFSTSEGVTSSSVLDSTNRFYRIANEIESPFDYDHLSFDLGLIYHLSNTRLSVVLRDFYETTIGDNLSQEEVIMVTDLGVGYRPVYIETILNIKEITISAELKDAFGDNDLFNKFHSGLEVNMYPFMIRTGISSGYFTYGATLQFIGVRFDFASTAEEGGQLPGIEELRSYRLGLKLGI